MHEACAFFDAVVLDCIFDECCAAIGDCFPLDMILDRIAEVVKSFPCLYFHVRLVFRHRHVYVPSLTDALSIFSRSKWWGSEILMYPLSIMSLIVELHMFIVERERKCDPRVRYSSPPQLRPSQNTSDVICERRTYMGRCRNLNGQESSMRQGRVSTTS